MFDELERTGKITRSIFQAGFGELDDELAAHVAGHFLYSCLRLWEHYELPLVAGPQ